MIIEAKHNVMETNQIIDLIRKISKQTNILGINASIEAARLGSEGRGFSIVASEVRNLAESTAASANRIADMLKRIQTNIVTISDDIQDYTVFSKNQTQVVQSLAYELENITTAVDDFTKLIK